MGSLLQVVDFSSDSAYAEAIRAIVDEVQRAVDVTDNASDIARFNAAHDEEWVEVSALTYELVCYARTAYDLTEGLYDPTAYWAVDLWGFLPRAQGTKRVYDRQQGADGAYPLPDDAYVEAFRSLTDMRKIEAAHDDEAGVYRLVKHASATVVDGVTYYAGLDLGGVAKGYVIERIARYARQNELSQGYVSFGSSSMLLLTNRKGRAWDLSLTHPRAKDGNAVYCTFPAQDTVVATSGDYQNYYVVDGVRYCHLVDPRTGAPMRSDLLSVTVLGGDGCIADALATALTVGGLEKLKAFAASDYARQNGLQFVAVAQEGQTLSIFSTISVESKL